MSSTATPITPAQFAEALKGLSISSLHLKVLELRNNIAHLDYSNEQLRPFAQGLQTLAAVSPSQRSTTPPTTQSEPDPDCVEAIKENEQVIQRMQQRIELIRAEVQDRGQSWTEFQTKEEADAAAAAARAAAQAEATNGIYGHAETSENAPGEGDGATESSPWTDGTFQTGVVRNGELVMNSVAGQSSRPGGTTGGGGGSISDEELRRRMEEQLRNLGDDGDDGEGGLHL